MEKMLNQMEKILKDCSKEPSFKSVKYEYKPDLNRLFVTGENHSWLTYCVDDNSRYFDIYSLIEFQFDKLTREQLRTVIKKFEQDHPDVLNGKYPLKITADRENFIFFSYEKLRLQDFTAEEILRTGLDLLHLLQKHLSEDIIPSAREILS